MVMAKLTIDAVDLYEVLLDGAVAGWSGPVESRCIDTDTGEGDIGRFGDVDAQYTD